MMGSRAVDEGSGARSGCAEIECFESTKLNRACVCCHLSLLDAIIHHWVNVGVSAWVTQEEGQHRSSLFV